MANKNSEGMDFLVSLPRRWVTVYIPLGVMLIILLGLPPSLVAE